MLPITGGVWPALITPLHDDGSVNFDNLDRLVELFLAQKLGGLYALGSTGQGPAFDLDTRRRVAEHLCRSARGRLPVMIHVGTVATEDAVELARHARRVGADAVSSVPPFYYPPDLDAVMEHYRRIGAAAELPFFPYHPQFLGQGIGDARPYVEQLLRIPNVAGMKLTIGDLSLFGLIHHYSGGRLKLFSGCDELMCQAVLSGAVGAIGTFYNFWGPQCAAVRKAFVAGDVERGRRFMLVFQDAIQRTTARRSSFHSFMRVAMKARYGIEIGPTRVPAFTSGPAWDENQVRQILDGVDHAAGCSA